MCFDREGFKSVIVEEYKNINMNELSRAMKEIVQREIWNGMILIS